MSFDSQGLLDGLAGRYRVEREAGRGGMATVYLATDLRHQRPVAIKALDQRLTSLVSVDRFLQEIRLLATLHHPHIVPLYDSGEVNGEVFYVMPYIIARAMLADAGTAERLTATGMALGTPGYMSPEQAAGDRAVDARADIYALGALTHEMLAGEPPFTGPSAQAVLARALTEAPQPLTRIRRGIAPAVSHAVQKALSPEPSDRFATANDFAKALSAGATVSDGTGRRAPQVLWWIGASVVAVGIAAWLLSRKGATDRPQATALRIAVIPFRDVGDAVTEGFSAGLTEALRQDLATLPDVDIVAGTSIDALGDESRQPRQVAQELRATHVISGTVQWSRDRGGDLRVRVSPEVIDVRNVTDRARSGAPIVERVDDLFQTQSRVSSQIANALGVPLSAEAVTRLARPPTRSRAAYEAFLRARVPSVESRVEYLAQAVALDSSFGAASADLAMAAAAQYLGTYDPRVAEIARQASARALALDRLNARAHVANVQYYRHVRQDYGRAVSHARVAVGLAPGDAEVMHFAAAALFSAGRMDEALSLARRGVDLDPRNASAWNRVSNILLWQRDHPGAEGAAQRALDLSRRSAAFINLDSLWLPMVGGSLPAAHAFLAGLPSEPRAQVAVIAARSWLEGWALDSASLRLGIDQLRRQGDLAYLHVALTVRAWQANDLRLTELHADSAATEASRRLQALPGEERLRLAMGYALALAGRCGPGIAHADSAHTARSIWQDAFFGAGNSLVFAEVLAVCGEKERALAMVDSLLAKPGLLTPAWLAIDPHFDGLHSDADFLRRLRTPTTR